MILVRQSSFQWLKSECLAISHLYHSCRTTEKCHSTDVLPLRLARKLILRHLQTPANPLAIPSLGAAHTPSGCQNLPLHLETASTACHQDYFEEVSAISCATCQYQVGHHLLPHFGPRVQLD